MPILDNQLSALLQQRSQWLNARTQVIVENISQSDMKKALRRELHPFAQILKKAPHAKTLAGKTIKDVKNVHVTPDDGYTTQTLISKEMEMLELSRTTIEHDGLMSIMKNIQRLFKTVLSKGQ